MRLTLLVMLVACSSKNPQREDLQLFCSQEAATHAKSFAELGPFLEPKLHDSDFKKTLLVMKGGGFTIDDFRKQVLLQLANEQIADCPTLAALTGDHPR
jgi:hypothetical protein